MYGLRSGAMLAAAIAVAGAPATAQTAPPPPVTLSGTATLVSDYRFRGLSQTDRDPAIQASASVETLAGPYASIWASTIGSYVARGADAELDLIAGYRKPIGGTTLDAGLFYYTYPGHGAGATDLAEPFVNVSRSYGPLTAKIGANVAWRQRALRLGAGRRGGAYAFGELAAGIPRTPVTVTAHVGHAFVANAVTFGRTYTDWSLGATYTAHSVTLGVSYVDTDTRDLTYPRATRPYRGNVAAGTALGTIGLSF